MSEAAKNLFPTCEVCGELIGPKFFIPQSGVTYMEKRPEHVCDPYQAMFEHWAKVFVKLDEEPIKRGLAVRKRIRLSVRRSERFLVPTLYLGLGEFVIQDIHCE